MFSPSYVFSRRHVPRALLVANVLYRAAPAAARVGPTGPSPGGPATSSNLEPGANSFTEKTGQGSGRAIRSFADRAVAKEGRRNLAGDAVYGSKPVSIGVDYRRAIVRSAPDEDHLGIRHCS